jgi:flagellar basal body-associated protein FliL
MKKQKHTMDIILVILAIFLLAFVGVMLWMYYITGGIPDTLCSCVFAICGGECGIMGWIQTTKSKMQPDEEKEEPLQ